MAASVDTSNVPGATGSVVSSLDGTVQQVHGLWAPGAAEAASRCAVRLLEDAAGMLMGRTGARFKRLAITLPDSGQAVIVTLDRDYIYVVRTTAEGIVPGGAAAASTL